MRTSKARNLRRSGHGDLTDHGFQHGFVAELIAARSVELAGLAAAELVAAYPTPRALKIDEIGAVMRDYVARGEADAVAFAALYIANPDLGERFGLMAAGETDVPLNAPDPSTYYWRGSGAMEAGYTDYPVLAGVRARV